MQYIIVLYLSGVMYNDFQSCKNAVVLNTQSTVQYRTTQCSAAYSMSKLVEVVLNTQSTVQYRTTQCSTAYSMSKLVEVSEDHSIDPLESLTYSITM